MSYWQQVGMRDWTADKSLSRSSCAYTSFWESNVWEERWKGGLENQMYHKLGETMLLVFFIALLYQNSSTLSITYHQSLYGDVAKAFNNILISRSILLKKFEVFSKVQCQAQCMFDASCMSFFHRQVGGLCQTHSIIFLDAGYGEPSDGTRYYILHEGQFLQS